MKRCASHSVALLAIVIGFMLLATNYGYIEGYRVQYWWPVIFVVAGVCKIAKHLSRSNCTYIENNSNKQV